MVVRSARSRLPGRNPGTSGDSASGSEVKLCGGCRKTSLLTKQVIHNGMQFLRVRYGLPYVELPDCHPSDLSRLLSFLLLQGKERPSVVFPRRQRPGKSIDGLCSLQRLCRRDRWALAHSLSSLKRGLPRGCRLHTPSARPAWEQNVCSQPPPPPSEYLQHVRRVCARLFRPGWDRNYFSFVTRHVPNASARKARASRADRLWSGRREEFLNACLAESELPSVISARYKEVMSAGKLRPLLIFDEAVELLGPLHKCLYSHLRKSDWLLCGPPTKERMASVCVGEYQTSVDLVAATDGLHHSVAEAILEVAFFSSTEVPRSLRTLAKASLSPTFEKEDGSESRVRHGQMMGSYLSFPLLCVQSFCAASWAARFDRDATFLVNGDDAVISAKRGITVQDYPPGYRLNSDKTIVARNVVEVNSTCFLESKGKWREVRHLRRGGAPTDYSGMLHMASAVLHSGAEWEVAYQRTRIGRRWGFLPSQLGHLTYAAYKRERQMRIRRIYTDLPVAAVVEPHASLRRIIGNDVPDRAREALRVHLWQHGRDGGMKRDEVSMSCGKLRRSYGYRAQPCRSHLSYVSAGTRAKLLRPAAAGFYLVPDWYETDEERENLALLELYRRYNFAGS